MGLRYEMKVNYDDFLSYNKFYKTRLSPITILKQQMWFVNKKMTYFYEFLENYHNRQYPDFRGINVVKGPMTEGE